MRRHPPGIRPGPRGAPRRGLLACRCTPRADLDQLGVCLRRHRHPGIGRLSRHPRTRSGGRERQADRGDHARARLVRRRVVSRPKRSAPGRRTCRPSPGSGSSAHDRLRDSPCTRAVSRHHTGIGPAHRRRIGADGRRPGPAGHHGSTGAGAHPADPQRRERAERRDRDAIRVPGAGAGRGRSDGLRGFDRRCRVGRSHRRGRGDGGGRGRWLAPVGCRSPRVDIAGIPPARGAGAGDRLIPRSPSRWVATVSSRRSWVDSRSAS